MIAGPNGSGKTTFYYANLRTQFRKFVNADEIAASLASAKNREDLNVEAANQADTLRRAMVAGKEDFAFETVFSRTPYWLDFLRALK